MVKDGDLMNGAKTVTWLLRNYDVDLITIGWRSIVKSTVVAYNRLTIK